MYLFAGGTQCKIPFFIGCGGSKQNKPKEKHIVKNSNEIFHPIVFASCKCLCIFAKRKNITLVNCSFFCYIQQQQQQQQQNKSMSFIFFKETSTHILTANFSTRWYIFFFGVLNWRQKARKYCKEKIME